MEFNLPCPDDHVYVHEDLRRLKKRDMNSWSIQDIFDNFDEISHEAMYESDDLSFIQLLTYIRDILKTTERRLESRSITLEEFSNLISSIEKSLEDVPDFMIAEYVQGSMSCPLINAIDTALVHILYSVNNHIFYKQCKGTFDDHIKLIETCQFDLDIYVTIIKMHNVTSSVSQMIERRKGKYFEVYELPTDLVQPDQDIYFMDLTPNQSRDSLLLRRKSYDKSLTTTIRFHPSFFKIFEYSSAIEEWRKRPSLGSPQSADRTCAICRETDIQPLEQLAVLSSCSHLFCISCTESWFKMKGMNECPLCRQVSTEYIRGAGYFNLVTKIQGSN